jgi:hypothetical protein
MAVLPTPGPTFTGGLTTGSPLEPHFSSHGTGGQTGIDGTSDAGTGVTATGGDQGVSASGGKVGVSGSSVSGVGVSGDNKSNTTPAVMGVCRGTAAGGTGVLGEGDFGRGVAGFSQVGQGVYGHSHSQAGVVGESDLFDGVWGVSHKLDAAGVSGHNPGGLAGYFDGNVVVTGDITLANADCAEDFDIGSAVAAEPGTVMVFGEDGMLLPCHQAYDKRVVGVTSGAGEYKPGIVLDRRPSGQARQAVALMGKVLSKVDAGYGAIEVGDLLTTSPTPGHAMKALDPTKAFGAVIGKAMRPLANGQGTIPVLIALQ